MPLFSPRLPRSTPEGGMSYWQRRGGAAVAKSRKAATDDPKLPKKADFIVVGAGLAGISSALALVAAEPGATIVVLEANYVGFGASGRNGGLMSPLPAPVWLLSADRDAEHAWALQHVNARVHEAAKRLKALQTPCGLAASALRMQSLGYFTAKGLDRVARTIERARIPLRRAKGTAGRLAVELQTHTLDPYATVRALADEARARGVSIFEHCPVMSIEETSDGVRVTLATGGSIDARRAILATNAYSESVKTPAKPAAKVVWNFMVAAPLTAVPASEGNAPREPTSSRFIVELNTSYVFYRIHDGNVVYGGIERFKPYGDDDFSVPPDVLAGLEKLLDTSFPKASLTPAQAWSGRYHQTSTDLPTLTRTGDKGRIVVNTGYGGTGVAMTMICAPLAAALARDGRFATSDDERLYRAITSTRLPIAGIARLVTGVASDVVMRRGGKAPV